MAEEYNNQGRHDYLMEEIKNYRDRLSRGLDRWFDSVPQSENDEREERDWWLKELHEIEQRMDSFISNRLRR